MIAVMQRVRQAQVSIEGLVVAEIGLGILALVAVEKGDGEGQAERMAERLLGYRIFADGEDRMNLSVQDIGGEVLLVSQFTLAADTGKGMRPSFTPAAIPEEGRRLFDIFVEKVRERHPRIATGRFGANMQVQLTNNGPVTFILKVPPKAS